MGDFRAPERVFVGQEVSAEVRQPAFIEGRTTGWLRTETSAYPILLRTTYNPSDPVFGYWDSRAIVGVERPFAWLWSALSHTFQVDVPFAYVGSLPRELQTLVLSYTGLDLAVDLRDDKLRTRRGAYFGVLLESADPIGNAYDVKVVPEARGYVPIGDRVVLAGRLSVGFLAPVNYSSPTGRQDVVVNPDPLSTQITYFRGFFSGGPNSNRGYPFRGISPRGVLTYFNPAVVTGGTEDCTDPAVIATADGFARCSVPVGGMSLWELSLEARVKVAGPFGIAGFCDASDVAPTPLDFRLTHPHLSCGGGVRLDTPVGALRVDAGVRVPGAQGPAGFATDVVEVAAGNIGGAPMAIQIGLGEVY
jgi:outer membrane protein insertion porin family/translocation and assembly module TamA